MSATDTALPPEVQAAAPPGRRGPVRLLIGVLFRPRATFAYLRDHGGRSWLWPLLAAVMLTLAARIVAVPLERAEALALQEALKDQVPDQTGGPGDTFTVGVAQGGLPIVTGGAVPSPSPLLSYGLPALGVLWDWISRGLLLLGTAWLLGGRPGLGAMFRLSGWALLPDIARLLVVIVVMLAAGRVPVRGLDKPAQGDVVNFAKGDENATEGQQQFVVVGPGGKTAGGPAVLSFLRASLLSALDVYTLWMLGLLVIGVAVTARLGWLRAAIATLAAWAITLGLAALPPLASFWLLRLAGPGIR